MPANKEIAKVLGISESTLSNIVNNRPGTSPKTKARVIAELKARGWDGILKAEESSRPSPASHTAPAKVSLSDEAAKDIAFLIFKRDGLVLGESSFSDLIQENVQKQVHRLGYELTVLYITLNSEIDYQIRRLRELNLAGILIFATEMHEADTALFDNFGVPIVSIDNDFTHLEHPIPSIIVNNKPGAYQAIKCLKENGHSQIGYIQAENPIYAFSNRRHRFESAFEAYGLPLQEEYCYKVKYSQFGCFNDFSRILDQPGLKLPTAFVTDDDIMAAGVMMALKMHGYSIPSDISIIGFSGRPLCNELVPKLCTISINKDQMAIESVGKLYTMITAFAEYPQLKELYREPAALSPQHYRELSDLYNELVASYCSVTGIGTRLVMGDSVSAPAGEV